MMHPADPGPMIPVGQFRVGPAAVVRPRWAVEPVLTGVDGRGSHGELGATPVKEEATWFDTGHGELLHSTFTFYIFIFVFGERFCVVLEVEVRRSCGGWWNRARPIGRSSFPSPSLSPPASLQSQGKTIGYSEVQLIEMLMPLALAVMGRLN